MVEALQGVISSSEMCLVQACHRGGTSHENQMCARLLSALQGMALWVGLCQQPEVNPFSNLSITIIAVVWIQVCCTKQCFLSEKKEPLLFRFTWSGFQAVLRFNNSTCSPGVRAFKTREVVWYLSQIWFYPLKKWAWKNCNLDCQFLCDIIFSVRYLQKMLHIWYPCMQTTCGSHREEHCTLRKLLQIISIFF